MLLKNKNDIEDFVRGCTFYGTGGGGSPANGLSILMDAFEDKGEIEVKDPSEIEDDSWTICAYGMGSIAPRTSEQKKEMKNLGLVKEKIRYKLVEAVKEFEEYTGEKIGSIVPLELGGMNTPAPVAAAVRLGIDAVNGDYAGGRAIPEVVQTMPHIHGERMSPLVSVDQWGDKVIIKESINNEVAEKIGKLVSNLTYGELAGNATYLIKGSRMKDLVVPDTLNEALEVGRAVRLAREENEDVVESIVESTGGYLLFEGEITEKDDYDREGYYWGTNTVKGTGEFEGKEFKCWFKNENHVSWLDGEPYVTSPDFMTFVDSSTGEPYTNTEIKPGMEMSVIGIKSHESFRKKEAIEVLGPRHFGHDIEYVPIEKKVKK